MNTHDLDAELAAARERNAALWQALVAHELATLAATFRNGAEPEQRTWDTGCGLPLTMNGCTLASAEDATRLGGLESVVDALLSGELEPVQFTLTADGRGAAAVFHTGDSDPATWVRYERWSARGCEAHGYVDPISRRIVQVG